MEDTFARFLLIRKAPAPAAATTTTTMMMMMSVALLLSAAAAVGAGVAVVAADTEATETPELARAPARKDWDPRLAAIAEGFVVFTVVTNLVEYVGVDDWTEVTAGMVTAL